MLLEMKDVLFVITLPEWQDDRDLVLLERNVHTEWYAEYTDYFIHKDRPTCEQNVFIFQVML